MSVKLYMDIAPVVQLRALVNPVAPRSKEVVLYLMVVTKFYYTGCASAHTVLMSHIRFHDAKHPYSINPLPNYVQAPDY